MFLARFCWWEQRRLWTSITINFNLFVFSQEQKIIVILKKS